MPSIPRPQCAHMMCKAPSMPHSRWCVDHSATINSKAPSRVDGDLYKGQAWLTLRAAQLSREPLCCGCKSRGVIQSASVADHIIPWRQLGREYFRKIPLQSLCISCHSIKTGLESRGIYRAFGYRDFGPDDIPSLIQFGFSLD